MFFGVWSLEEWEVRSEVWLETVEVKGDGGMLGRLGGGGVRGGVCAGTEIGCINT
jgi:hypothetical protein